MDQPRQPDIRDLLLTDIRDALWEILKAVQKIKPKKKRVKQGNLWKTIDGSVPDVSEIRERWHAARGMGIPKGSTWELDAVLASLSASCNNDAGLASKAIAAYFACRETFTVSQGHSVKEFARTMDRWVREALGKAPVANPDPPRAGPPVPHVDTLGLEDCRTPEEKAACKQKRDAIMRKYGNRGGA